VSLIALFPNTIFALSCALDCSTGYVDMTVSKLLFSFIFILMPFAFMILTGYLLYKKRDATSSHFLTVSMAVLLVVVYAFTSFYSNSVCPSCIDGPRSDTIEFLFNLLNWVPVVPIVLLVALYSITYLLFRGLKSLIRKIRTFLQKR
jgi:cytochrome bd-type quinol oxidase subunit 2